MKRAYFAVRKVVSRRRAGTTRTTQGDASERDTPSLYSLFDCTGVIDLIALMRRCHSSKKRRRVDRRFLCRHGTAKRFRDRDGRLIFSRVSAFALRSRENRQPPTWCAQYRNWREAADNASHRRVLSRNTPMRYFAMVLAGECRSGGGIYHRLHTGEYHSLYTRAGRLLHYQRPPRRAYFLI